MADTQKNKTANREHILVCLSSSPTNGKIIQIAASMAKAYGAGFTALFVQTPAFEKTGRENKSRLADNISLAQQLGATVATVYGDDVPFQIAEYARLSAVTKIVIGASGRRMPWQSRSLDRQLAATATGVDIHIIPDFTNSHSYHRHRPAVSGKLPEKADLAKTFAILAAVTTLGLLFDMINVNEANIITLYILGVLVTAVVTQGYLCSMLSAIISVPLFDFLFTDPRFNFHVSGESYPVTFIIMLLVSLITGSLATRLKQSASRAAQSAYRTKILFDTNQLLKNVHDEKEIINLCAGQINKLLAKDTIAYAEENGRLGRGTTFSSRLSGKNMFLFISEELAAKWAFNHRRRRGAGTANIPDTQGTYLPVETGDKIYGVIGIMTSKQGMDFFSQSIVTSIIGECSLAMENARNARERQLADEKIKSEQLRSNLLRTISHDLRTPLTTISGNADNLLSNYEKMDEKDIKQAFSDIYDDSRWLTGVVENILSVTRIEEGRLNLNLSDELIEDVILEAANFCIRKKSGHNIRTIVPDEILMAKIDRSLIMQVIVNLVENAIKYTPPTGDITISAGKDGEKIYVSVADNGPGIKDRDKEHIFEMFYTGEKKAADSRRSLGLGLSLCKSIVNAHGGVIQVADNKPQGCVFTFTLPLSEVKIHD